MTRCNETLSRATIDDVILGKDGAEATSRCLPDPMRDHSEYREDGAIDGVPVSIYYILTPEDQARWAECDNPDAINWISRIDRIGVNLAACDRQQIDDAAIEALIARLG